jgi:hypothetical protein
MRCVIYALPFVFVVLLFFARVEKHNQHKREDTKDVKTGVPNK